MKRRACANCTAAKAKCIHLASESICERCARLGKQCTYLDLPERKRKQRATRRLESLESRVDDLTARLSGPSTDDRPAIAKTSSTQFSPAALLTPSASTSAAGNNTTPTSLPAGGGPPRPKPHSHGHVDIIDRGIITEEYAARLLTEFKLHQASLFPFVVLGSTDTASTLRAESPLLFLITISVALCKNAPLQKLLGEEFQSIVSSRLVLQADGGTLDALQALLVFAAWHHYFIDSQTHSQLYTVTQLCVVLVFTLRLETRTALNPAEERALLGTYWLCSCVGRALRRQPALRYTRRMQECCERLAAAGEYTTDRWIRPLVLLESLACRVSDTFSYPDLVETSVRGREAVSRAIDRFMDELDLTRIFSGVDSWPSADRSLFMMEYHYVASYIREVAFHDELWLSDASRETIGQEQQPTSSARTSTVWRLLDSDKSCINSLLAAAETRMVYLPATVYWRLCYILANLIKLGFTLLDGGCELSHAMTSSPAMQSTLGDVDLVGIINNMVTKLDNEDTRANTTSAYFIWKLRKLSIACKNKLREAVSNVNPESARTDCLEDCPVAEEVLRAGLVIRTEDDQDTSSVLPNPPQPQTGDTSQQGAETGQLPSNEFHGFDFNDMEWEAIMNAFTLPD